MKCPRCRASLADGLERSVGGAYRRGPSTERGCLTCEFAVYTAPELAEHAGTTQVDLRRSPLCRVREPIDAPCGNCSADVRDALHLSWEGIRDVVVEVCGGCGTIAVARRDGERLQRMLQAAEPMHRSG